MLGVKMIKLIRDPPHLMVSCYHDIVKMRAESVGQPGHTPISRNKLDKHYLERGIQFNFGSSP